MRLVLRRLIMRLQPAINAIPTSAPMTKPEISPMSPPALFPLLSSPATLIPVARKLPLKRERIPFSTTGASDPALRRNRTESEVTNRPKQRESDGEEEEEKKQEIREGHKNEGDETTVCELYGTHLRKREVTHSSYYPSKLIEFCIYYHIFPSTSKKLTYIYTHINVVNLYQLIN